LIRNKDKLNILIANFLAEDRGHLIDDDLFLVECLTPLADTIEISSSPVSINNINKHFKVKTSYIKEFNILKSFPRIRLTFKHLTLRCSRYNEIVFPAFEEVTILFFMLLHPNKRVHLIYHNNLSLERKERHPFLWALFTTMVAKRAATLLVPTRYQADLLIALSPQINSSKIFIRPLNQMAEKEFFTNLSKRQNAILFLGPSLERKPVEPILDLIKKDHAKKYKYILTNIDDLDAEVREYLALQSNVEIRSGYIGADEYYRLFRTVSWVITTHNHLFEGKLSGVFCDAISAGTPLVARDMSPHDEFFVRFGDMGVLVDFNDSCWCDRFLNMDFSKKIDEFQNNMKTCRISSSMAAIREVFRLAINHE